MNEKVTIYEVDENKHTIEFERTWSSGNPYGPLYDWAASKSTKDNPKDFRFWMLDDQEYDIAYEIVLVGAWLVEKASPYNYTLGFKEYRASKYDPYN